MNQYEIAKDHGISRNAVQITQKKLADVGSVLCKDIKDQCEIIVQIW